MFKILCIFSILILSLSNEAFSNKSIENKQLIKSAHNAFKQGNVKKLKKIKTTRSNKELDHWISFWLIKLKIKENPFDEEIKLELDKFGKSSKFKFLVTEAYKFWAHEVIKLKNWPKTVKIIDHIKKVSPLTTSRSIKCVLYLSKKDKNITEIYNLTWGQEHRVGCLKLILDSVEKYLVNKEFVIKSSRSAAIKGKISHAEKILRYSKKYKISINSSEYKLLKILNVSQKNSLRALRRLNVASRSLDDEQKKFASMAVGSSLSGITHPSSLRLVKNGLSSVHKQPLYILESSARIALRYGDWNLLKTVIEAMPLKTQKLPRWKYWEAQRLLAEGEKNKSVQLLDSIKPQWSFYGMLAGEELARIYDPKKHVSYRIPSVKLNQKKIINSSSFTVAIQFYELGLYKEGRMEWENLLSKETDKSLINVANYSSSIKAFDRSISAALKTKNKHNFYLRYPTPYLEIVKKESSVRKISPFLVMGLMRQESRFKKKITSTAGAIGLMQLMPSTARSVARKIKIKSINKKKLVNPEINIKLGSEYLAILFSKFKKSTLLTVSSYNAGPSRSKKWKKSLITDISGAAFTESIPFDETRDYVKSVLSAAVMYSRLYDKTDLEGLNIGENSFITLQSLLGSVKPDKNK